MVQCKTVAVKNGDTAGTVGEILWSQNYFFLRFNENVKHELHVLSNAVQKGQINFQNFLKKQNFTTNLLIAFFEKNEGPKYL